MDNRPIGVFDSGLGGLTVLKESIKILDNEDYIYLGDTLRMPYGNKSEEEIIKFSFEISEFLKRKDVKAILIACNTVSSVAYEKLKENIDIPIIISVLNEGVEMTLKEEPNKNVVFIGTERTVLSNSFERKIKDIDKGRNIKSIACPEFAEIVEKGEINTKETEKIVKKYLEGVKNWSDILVYGCTHYPLLEEKIKRVLGDKIYIDPAIGLRKKLEILLKEKDLMSNRKEGSIEFYVTKDPDSFKNFAEKIRIGRAHV